MKINELFNFKTGSLPALEKTDDGDVPLVYGTSLNNGVIKFVSVDSQEDIFQPPLITVSYLGTAFVQILPFTTSVVDKSNIIILEPKNPMSLEELYYYCYQINRHGKFGFHYGRRMNMARLRTLELIPFNGTVKPIQFKPLLPKIPVPKIPSVNTTTTCVPVTQIFEIVNAKSKSYDLYDPGNVAFISNGLINNGIVGYVTPYKDDRVFYNKAICVSAFCEATLQTPPFLPRGNGGSGLIVLNPRIPMTDSELMFYVSFINKFCKWRFNYGRMVTKERFAKLSFPVIS